MTGAMPAYRFDHALLSSGWARDVRVDVAGGAIARMTPNAPRDDAPQVAGFAIPGMPNLHCHAFQRGMAGLAEKRGPAHDSFWGSGAGVEPFPRRAAARRPRG